MDAILPIVKQYGAAVVALTLDENGIPPTAEERLAIARRIVERAEAMGIPREDVLVDCLVLTASTNQAMVLQTLRAVSLVRRELGCRTVLGVSNVSFGLPARETLNATFLGAAFGAGLDMPILNPLSKKYGGRFGLPRAQQPGRRSGSLHRGARRIGGNAGSAAAGGG